MSKQETLEEAAERCFEEMKSSNPKGGIKEFVRLAVNYGAKWQAERMYSEEEVYNILVEHTIELFKGQPCTLNEFFEQFKKK